MGISLAGGYMYFGSSHGGNTVVVRAGATCDEVARNGGLYDRFSSSPLIVDNRLYLRGRNRMHCIGTEGNDE
jgi:hypothetical protein